MNAPRRRGPEPRRNPAVRTIRTNEVRYPGAKLPDLPPDIEERYRAAMGAEVDGGQLTSGVRDTGLAIEGRLARQQRAKRRNQQRLTVAAAVAVLGVLLLAIGWHSASERRAPTAPLGGNAAAALSGSSGTTLAGTPVQGHVTPTVIASSATTPAIGPTPIFASYRKLKLRLPVPVKRLTEIGFHQAAYAYALPMKTPLPDAKLSSAGNRRGTHRDISEQPTGEDAVLVGKVLRMWRPRPGRPDTAADVGAKPGTAVLSPVTGTVVKVKRYKLYGKWTDYEIHIQPDGYPQLDVVMIHVKNVSVKPGERVEAGLTRVAAVRKLSDKFYDQLGSYTKGGGDHVHLQVNDADDPKYEGLEGAVEPEPEPAEVTTSAQSIR